MGLWGCWQGCGKVLSVRLPRYHDSNRPRGYAHVEFKKPQGVDVALKLDGERRARVIVITIVIIHASD
jgi:hypothetical protein